MTGLDRDQRLLFATRSVRLFGYGLVSVILVLYLAEAGLDGSRVGALLTLTLVGDAAISLWMTTRADRLGRKRMLLAGAGLMLLAAAVFAATRDFWLLCLAATIGVISPSGNEVGPFLAVEQSALTQNLANERRTSVLAWYNLAGSLATALGAQVGGAAVTVLRARGVEAITSFRVVILGYGVVGLALLVLFTLLSPSVEPAPDRRVGRLVLGLSHSKGIVARLSVLFALDAFGGGLVVTSLVAYWFHRRFGVEPALLGTIFMGANVLAGFSALSAAWVARRIGLINTMVATHLPSNVLLALVPLMPTLPLAIGVLLLRFSISQMDVPTRQSYLMAVVSPEERSAAAGVTGIARTLGAALAPLIAAPLLASSALLSVPFLLSGGIKSAYDLALWASFRAVRPPEEAARARSG